MSFSDPAGERGRGVSLWLAPDGAARARFAEAIERASRALGTPRFEPHVTLLGGVELEVADAVVRARDLADRLAPLPLRLVRSGGQEVYFRALYLEVDPDPAIVAAHAAAARALGREPDPGYFPHLSLAYAWLDADARRRVLHELGDLRSECAADRLEVVRTDGPVGEWALEDRFALGGTA